MQPVEDITDWLKLGEVRVISDIEGGRLEHFVKKSDNLPYSGKVIVCGDLIDSTVSAGSVALLKRLLFNIRNLIKCVTDKNILYVLGNRDLNKIKVYHLTTLKDTPQTTLKDTPQTPSHPDDIRLGRYINNFNRGSISNDQLLKAYAELVEEFKNNRINYNCTMNNWYTFWSGGLGTSTGRKWSNEVDYTTTPFLKRFNDIFGPDNSVGTMDAQILLHTIPTELGQNGNDDYKAFFVLYVFRIMLMQPLLQQPSYSIENIKTNIFNLCGLLRAFYTKGHGILYALTFNKSNKSNTFNKSNKSNQKNELLVFSHGGLTSNFSYNQFKNLYYSLNNKLKFFDALTDASHVQYVQKGGTNISQIALINNINLFNTLFKKQIEEVLKSIRYEHGPRSDPYDLKPYKSMLFLLMISSPFNCRTFQSKLLNRNSINCRSMLFGMGEIGPIVSGIRDLIKYPLRLSDVDLIQIFGHYSVGIGASIADVSVKSRFPFARSHKSLLVNLDVTNTFSHTNPFNMETSKTMLIFFSGQIHLYTFLNTMEMPDLYITTLKDQPKPQTIIINQDLHNIATIQQYVTARIFDNPRPPVVPRLFFHGIGTNGNGNGTENYAVFTLNKNLYGRSKDSFKSKYLIIPITKARWLEDIMREANF
jgi:hypothetical protein